MITVNSDIKTFLLPTDKGMLVLHTENIIRIQAISNYSKIYFSSAPGGGREGVGITLVVAKLLKWFEYKLLDYAPESWTNLKCALLLKSMAQTLNMVKKILR